MGPLLQETELHLYREGGREARKKQEADPWSLLHPNSKSSSTKSSVPAIVNSSGYAMQSACMYSREAVAIAIQMIALRMRPTINFAQKKRQARILR